MSGVHFIKLLSDDGSYWQWRKVDPIETFRDLKRKLMMADSVADYSTLMSGILDVDFRFLLHFLDPLQKPKLPYEPYDSQNIVGTLKQLEERSSGIIVVSFARRNVLSQHQIQEGIINYEQAEWNSCQHKMFYEVSSNCSDFMPASGSFSNDTLIPNFGDSLLMQVADTAIAQGWLQRKIILPNKSEIWKDQYCLLEPSRLWLLNLKTWETEKQLYFVDLGTQSVASILDKTLGTFTISNCRFEFECMVFKAKQPANALAWVGSINTRLTTTGNCDNDLMGDIENSIVDEEMGLAKETLYEKSNLIRFESIVSNRFTRSKLYSIIGSNSDETYSNVIRCWERTEDYKLHHSSSSSVSKYELQESSNTDEESTQNSEAENDLLWRELIENEFLSSNSPFPLGDRIQGVIAEQLQQQRQLLQGNDDSMNASFGSDEPVDIENNKCDHGVTCEDSCNFSREAIFLINQILGDYIENLLLVEALQQKDLRHCILYGTPYPPSVANTTSSSSASSSKRGIATSRSFVVQSSSSSPPSSPSSSPSSSCPWRHTRFTKCLPLEWWHHWNKVTADLAANNDESPLQMANNMRRQSHQSHIRCVLNSVTSISTANPPPASKSASAIPNDLQVHVSAVDMANNHLHHMISVLRSGLMRCQYKRAIQQPQGLSRFVSSNSSSSSSASLSLTAVASSHSSVKYSSPDRTARVLSTNLSSQTPPPTFSNTASMNTSNSPMIGSVSVGDMDDSRMFASRQTSQDEGAVSVSTVGPEEALMYVVLVVVLGKTLMILSDPNTNAFVAAIDMDRVVEVRLPESVLNCIDVVDCAGLAWQLHPVCADEDESRALCQNWLSVLYRGCGSRVQGSGTSGGAPPENGKIMRRVDSVYPALSIETIVHAGYLAKRGAVNISFKRRWFILTSRGQLRYYSDPITGVYKGSISLSVVKSVSINGTQAIATAASTAALQFRRFFRINTPVASVGTGSGAGAGAVVTHELRELTLETSNRLWVLQADTAVQCSVWVQMIDDFISHSGRGVSGQWEEDEGDVEGQEEGQEEMEGRDEDDVS